MKFLEHKEIEILEKMSLPLKILNYVLVTFFEVIFFRIHVSID